MKIYCIMRTTRNSVTEKEWQWDKINGPRLFRDKERAEREAQNLLHSDRNVSTARVEVWKRPWIILPLLRETNEPYRK